MTIKKAVVKGNQSGIDEPKVAGLPVCRSHSSFSRRGHAAFGNIAPRGRGG